MRFVLVLIACLTAFVGAYPASQAIQNDVFWKDLSGKPIYSQGGGVLKVKDTYYWYGAHYKEAESYFSNPAKHLSATTFSSVTCYSSDDLVNWKFEGDVFTGPARQSQRRGG